MKRIFWILPLILLLGCPKVEQDARDTAAALKGALTQAQTEYTSTCQSDSAQPTCQTINKAISAQNLLITATQAYCGWSASAPPDPAAKCAPVKGTEASLQTATKNAQQAITELKGIIH